MSSPCFKAVHIKPITGFLDNRSTADEVPVGGYRRAQNVEVTQKNKLCRMEGWEKLLSNNLYNNEDLHDQLAEIPQTINYLQQFVSNAGLSKLFAGTQNRLYALNNSIGNWKIIWDGIGGDPIAGCPDKSWYAGQVNNTVVFTNGTDFGYHDIDQPVNEGTTQSVAPILDAAKIKLTKVGLVISWNNLMFYMNLELDGVRQSDVLLWSDFKRPLSLVPKPSVSLAGKKSLGTNHSILNARELGNVLMIYTTKGIWEVSVVGGLEVLSFRQVFSANDDAGRSRCIAYPNTLVSTGDDHYYFGKDGIYLYNVYLAKPDRVDWIHRATATIFDDINTGKCKVHVGAHHSNKKSILWSWLGAEESCPTRTFVVNTEYQFTSYIDAGFTALCNYSPDKPKSLREFILERCICTQAQLDAFGGLFVNEGGFCLPQTDPACPVRPTSFYTETPLVDDDVTTEDWTQAEPDENSLCALLEGVTPQDLCDAEFTSDQCDAALIFIMAATLDNTIKQQTRVFYREKCTNKGGCGTYQKLGYRTLLTSGPVDLRLPDDDKVINLMEIEAYPDDQTVPSSVNLRVGTSSQAHDPLVAGGRCPILWQIQDPLSLECTSPITSEQHLEEGTRPDSDFSWPLWITGRFFYYEFEVVNPDVTPVDTGGSVCISRITFYAKAAPIC